MDLFNINGVTSSQSSSKSDKTKLSFVILSIDANVCSLTFKNTLSDIIALQRCTYSTSASVIDLTLSLKKKCIIFSQWAVNLCLPLLLNKSYNIGSV